MLLDFFTPASSPPPYLYREYLGKHNLKTRIVTIGRMTLRQPSVLIDLLSFPAQREERAELPPDHLKAKRWKRAKKTCHIDSVEVGNLCSLLCCIPDQTWSASWSAKRVRGQKCRQKWFQNLVDMLSRKIIMMPRPRKKPLRDSGRHRRQVSRLLQGREVLQVFKFYSPLLGLRWN